MPKLEISEKVVAVSFDESERDLAASSHTRLAIINGMGCSKDGLKYEKNCETLSEMHMTVRRVDTFLRAMTSYKRSASVIKVVSYLEESEAQVRKVISGDVEALRWDENCTLNFPRELFEYQVPSVEHMMSIPHAANFSVPGSGKTTITYAAFSALRGMGKVEKMLVVCPRSAFKPWEDEYKDCFRIPYEGKVVRITGPKDERVGVYAGKAGNPEVLLMSYDTLRNDQGYVATLISAHRTMLVLDESHRIKSVDGKTSEACLAVSGSAVKRVILTGTPAPNGMADLWKQITFLYPNREVLWSFDQYERRAGERDENGEIRTRIRPLYSRIRKSDLHLRDPALIPIEVQMGPRQSMIYNRIVSKIISDFDSMETVQKLGEFRRAALVRMMQAASNPSLLLEKSEEFELGGYETDGSFLDVLKNYHKLEVPAKFQRAAEEARRAAKEGRKTVIWTNFISNVKAMASELSDLGAVKVFGGIPLSEGEAAEESREGNIRRFKEDPSVMVLVANPAACAESISLHTVCHTAIYLDRTYNAGHFIQSKDRIHRIGLPPDVETTYMFLMSENTVDERIDQRLRTKEERLNMLMEDDFAGADMDFNILPSGRLENALGISEEDIDDALLHARVINSGQTN